MKTFCLVAMLLLISCQSVTADTIRVSDPEKLKELTTLKPGDIVIIEPGIYNSASISFNANGTSDSPVILKAAKQGEVIITGNSTIKISGNNIIVSDLWFKNPVPSQSKSIIELRCNDSKLVNCLITGFDTKSDSSTDNKWVSVYGQRNTVTNCTFADKRNIGCLLVVWLEKDIIPSHKILNNYFTRPHILYESDGSKMNGQECVRIGTSDFSMQRADCLVEGNTFYRCDSEIEVISNKSCFNIFRGNLFYETQGALTLRHGNNSFVEKNFFIGNGREGTAGIRIIGDHQIVTGNYFENTRGKNYMAAICLIQGVPDSPLNRYFQVTDTKIEKNTILNCYNAIVVSYGNSPDQSLPVISTEINENIICNDSSTNNTIVWIDKPQKPEIKFRDNIIYGGQSVNFNEVLAPKTTVRPKCEKSAAEWLKIKTGSGADWTPKEYKF